MAPFSPIAGATRPQRSRAAPHQPAVRRTGNKAAPSIRGLAPPATARTRGAPYQRQQGHGGHEHPNEHRTAISAKFVGKAWHHPPRRLATPCSGRGRLATAWRRAAGKCCTAQKPLCPRDQAAQYEVRSVASARCFLGRFLPKLGGASRGAATIFMPSPTSPLPRDDGRCHKRTGTTFRELEPDQAALAAFRGRPAVLRATSGIAAAGLRPRPIDLASAERFSA